MAFVPPKLLRDNNPGPPASSKQMRQPRASALAGSGRHPSAGADAVVPRLAVSNDRRASDLNAVTTISRPGDHINIVPPDNLRLPDALTVKYGPAPLLARFVLEGDKEARRRGVDLRLRHDFRELLYLAKTISIHDKLFRRLEIFNPDYTDFTPENSYWIAGYDEHGEIVLTSAGRIYDWRCTNLEHEARVMFYSRDVAPQCEMTDEF